MIGISEELALDEGKQEKYQVESLSKGYDDQPCSEVHCSKQKSVVGTARLTIVEKSEITVQYENWNDKKYCAEIDEKSTTTDLINHDSPLHIPILLHLEEHSISSHILHIRFKRWLGRHVVELLRSLVTNICFRRLGWQLV